MSNLRAFIYGMLSVSLCVAAVTVANVKDTIDVFPGVETDMKDAKCVKINPSVMRCRDSHATCYIYWEKGVSCVSRGLESIAD